MVVPRPFGCLRHAASGKPTSRRRSSGFMLVEVLVSILIFAFGILALLGLHARATHATGQVQARAEAMQLINAYVGSMWAAGLGVVDDTGSDFTSGNAYNHFKASAKEALPTSLDPEVDISSRTSDLPDTARIVTITLRWLDPDGSGQHNYSQTNIVGLNPKAPAP